MTPLEFSNQMDRLCRTYGEKSYPKERMDAFYERVKAHHAAQFEKAITYLIGESFQPIPLSKLIEAMGPPTQVEGETRFQKWDRENPVQPLELRKQWAAKYGGEIQAMLRGIGKPLPYDPTRSVEDQPLPKRTQPPTHDVGSPLGDLIDKGFHLSEEERKARGFA
jgi:hypothetical protein